MRRNAIQGSGRKSSRARGTWTSNRGAAPQSPFDKPLPRYHNKQRSASATDEFGSLTAFRAMGNRGMATSTGAEFQ